MANRCDDCGHWYSVCKSNCPKCDSRNNTVHYGIYDDEQLKIRTESDKLSGELNARLRH